MSEEECKLNRKLINGFLIGLMVVLLIIIIIFIFLLKNKKTKSKKTNYKPIPDNVYRPGYPLIDLDLPSIEDIFPFSKNKSLPLLTPQEAAHMI